jgi:ABC-type phosphate transport system substrate-binding protein
MKLKQLTVACSAALLSGQVFAHAPSVVPDETIWISGASAQDKALAALATNLCVAGTLDTFKDGGSGKAYTSYFCTIDSSQVPGMSVDKKVLINKRSAGGSGKGVQVVADGVAIEAMNINNGNCTDADANRVWDCDISGGVAGGDLVMQVSDAGISDVEPAMFTGPNVPPGDLAVTPAQVAKLDITSMNAVIFGVPITEKLYRALQIAQGKGNSDSEADMPSLSTSQVNALITGGITKWDQLLINGTPLTSYPGVTPPAPDVFGPLSNPLVHICRRVPGSGTQAQMNAIFANTPCAAGVQDPLRAPGNPATGPIVQENSGSGDVTVCLQTKQAANKWAIGVQSLEKLDASFRFVKIDGVAPTLKNVAENKYKDWVETTMQWRNAANGGPDGDTLNILKKIATDASTPSTIASLNASFVHGFGTGAYLALNTNGHTPSFPHSDANPVTTATHAPLGTPNTCNIPQVNITSTL